MPYTHCAGVGKVCVWVGGWVGGWEEKGRGVELFPWVSQNPPRTRFIHQSEYKSSSDLSDEQSLRLQVLRGLIRGRKDKHDNQNNISQKSFQGRRTEVRSKTNHHASEMVAYQCDDTISSQRPKPRSMLLSDTSQKKQLEPNTVQVRLGTRQDALRATKRATTTHVSTRQTHQVTRGHCSRFSGSQTSIFNRWAASPHPGCCVRLRNDSARTSR